ncbi:MAG: hypothetical protein KC416_02700 [Myxococcales bacterium]|nr:hypothetical protein [Myxococcales bacterium]
MRLWYLFALAGLAASAGCAPAIGDDCEVSTDCSVSGDRACDRSQPGGYCTVPNCDTNTCPEEAVCVEYLYQQPRLAQTWCLATCEDDGDCRGGAYSCTKASEILDATGSNIARVIDTKGDSIRFCAVK